MNWKGARRKYCEALRSRIASVADRKEFRKKIKGAKLSFYLKKVVEASKARDVFDIIKWHETKGFSQAPPLRNSLAPDNLPSQPLEEKREFFVKNHSNQSKVLYFSLNMLKVPKKSIPIPKITNSEDSRSIFGAGNATPRNDGSTTALLRLA